MLLRRRLMPPLGFLLHSDYQLSGCQLRRTPSMHNTRENADNYIRAILCSALPKLKLIKTRSTRTRDSIREIIALSTRSGEDN